NGQETFEFKNFGSMQDFIRAEADQDQDSVNRDIWVWLHTSNNVKQLEFHLTFIQSSKFPPLNKNRTLFGFENGIYSTQFDRFTFWDEVNQLPFQASGQAVAKFHKNNYFENSLYELILDKTGRDWYHLPTPYLFKLFDAQMFSEEV